MATSENKIFEEQKKECEKVAQEKFNKILAAYRQIIDEINPTHFKSIDQLLKKETKKGIDIENTANVFKEHLFDIIKKKFTNTWNELGMNEKLIALEYSKNNLTCDKAWRPTNKSVNEQFDPQEVKSLLKHKEFLMHQIEFQNQQIASIVPQIEDTRRLLKNRIEKRNSIKMQINKDIEKVEKVENEIAAEIKKYYDID